MADHDTLIIISAFSGLVGALLTQLLTGLFGHIGDQRKYRIELRNSYRDKKLDIGENFYYLNSETMALLKKSIQYWQKRNQFASEHSLELISKEIKGAEEQIAKAYSENRKYNLVNLYFPVMLSVHEINEENQKSHTIYLKIRAILEELTNTPEEKRAYLYGQYSFTTYELISQYERIYDLLEQDINLVKNELLKVFEE